MKKEREGNRIRFSRPFASFANFPLSLAGSWVMKKKKKKRKEFESNTQERFGRRRVSDVCKFVERRKERRECTLCAK